MNKALNEDIISMGNVDENDMLVDNNFDNFQMYSFDNDRQQDYMENGLNTNNLSTNFFSKGLKNDADKI